MKARIALLSIFIGSILFLVLMARAQNRAADITTREVMQLKLGHAQKILEGIATEDYELILQNAQKLDKLAQGTGWYARQTPEYELFTTEFRRHVKSLEKAAQQNNLDAATGAYFQMTVSCTSCHKYMRGRKEAALDGELNLRPAIAAVEQR